MVEVQAEEIGEEHVGALTQLGERLLNVIERPHAELSVLLCSDEGIRELNRQYRHRDEPTDVLSFPQGDEVLLGDIVISIPTAERQAAELGHQPGEELALLLVHGLLHLVGYDHQTDDEAAEMRGEEERLLGAVGVTARGLVGRVSPH